MDWHNGTLFAAGIIGIGVALIHGVLTQRLMVRPVAASFAEQRARAAIRMLVPALLQFSTYNWLLGGLALIGAALWLGPEARLAVGLLVGSSYLYGAIANGLATRGRHPGWALYAVAVTLIVVSLAG